MKPDFAGDCPSHDEFCHGDTRGKIICFPQVDLMRAGNLDSGIAEFGTRARLAAVPFNRHG